MSDHCVIDTTEMDGVLRLRCTRCDGFLELSLPVPVDSLPAIGDAFKALHAGCMPKWLGGEEP